VSIDVARYLEPSLAHSPDARGISTMAQNLVGSEILRVAGEVRAQIAAGHSILNLTVGDFSSTEFPIPEALSAAITDALAAGHSNYPPATGVMECRVAVQKLYKERLGLDYPVDSVIIAGGARPVIAALYMALVNPGDKVVYGVPSWNNEHYCTITGGVGVPLGTSEADRFFFHTKDLLPHLADARLLVLNTPQNPTGTVMSAETLELIAREVVQENLRRQAEGRPALYVMFDQIYWMLTFHGSEHHNPVSLVPEVAPYVLFVDGISKGFAATGLRVGWGVGPVDVIKRMGAILSHLGAWAPKPEQVASAHFMNDTAAMDAFLARMHDEVGVRLDIIARALNALEGEGWTVHSIRPQGAIYLSLRIDLRGKETADGKVLETDEDVRHFLLNEAGIAVIPFRFFGVQVDTGWYRASVGAVSKEDCASIEGRLRGALAKLS